MKTSFAVMALAGLAFTAAGCAKPEEPKATTPPAETTPPAAAPTTPPAAEAPPAAPAGEAPK